MPRREILDRIQKYVHPFRITKGKGFRLKDFDPTDTGGLKLDKGEAAELLTRGTEWLAEEQDMLYAQDCWSLLLVFQAMDAAGKDGTIKHIMSGVNPQGCQVFSFKQPSSAELDHDFMWRHAKRFVRIVVAPLQRLSRVKKSLAALKSKTAKIAAHVSMVQRNLAFKSARPGRGGCHRKVLSAPDRSRRGVRGFITRI